jgi:uncharacterized RDD family membrane protein YckC
MEGWQVFFEIPGKPPVELPDGESIIGRSRTSAVHIPETTVSRQHARVVVAAAGEVVLHDLGSSNGTYVNGEKVEQQRRLADGDRVMVGDAELTLRVLAPIEPSDATVRVSIPPLAAPVGAGTVRLDGPAAPAAPPPPPAAVPPAHAATVAAPRYDRPVDPPLHPAPSASAPPPPPRLAPAAAPPPAPAPARPAVPAPPSAARSSAAPAAAGKQEMLGSIAELDKMPLPPAKKGAASAAPAKVPAAAGALAPAGFWIRVVAAMIDGALAGVVMGVLFALGFAAVFVLPPELAMVVSSGLMLLASLGFGFLFGLYYPAKKGATPGKRLLKLAIVSDETSAGQGLGWSKAFVRLLGHLVCSFTFSLGYVMVAFTSRKQGLHDLIAKTYVVRSR